jgi:outer membrane protein assembly factor BamB
MADPQLKNVACPSCGESLAFGAGVITIRCPSCSALVERPPRADLPASLRSDSPAPPSANPASANPAPDSSRVFMRLAFILGLVCALGVISMAAFFLIRDASRSGFNLLVNGPVAVLTTDTPEEPEVISLSYDVTGETYLFARLNPIKRKVVWRGKKFKSISDIRTIVTGDGKFFAVEGTELHAYRDTDGSELWQAKLTDELGYCDECLSVAGGRAITLTQDYVIQAFDITTGASAWKRRMDGYTKGFTIADDGLWVIDKVNGQYSLLFLNMEDGTVRKQIATECRRTDGAVTSNLASISAFLLDPDPSVRASDRSVYLLYGWDPGCIERWDASSTTLLWQAVEDEGYSPSNDFATLFTPEALYFAYQDVLWSVTKSSGQVRVLAEGGDYELVPLAVEQEVLILRTKRTRGTSQFGLRGFDPAAGSILWDYPIENSAPYDPPDAAFRHVDKDQAVWTWRISGGLLHVYMFQADPNQFSISTLNPKDGTFSPGETLAFHFSFDSYFGPEILFWKDTTVWFVADSKIMAIDVSAAKIMCQFP